MELIATIITLAVIFLLLTLYSSLTWGLVLYKFWYWFLLPVFPILPEINYVLSVGLIMFISLFHKHSTLSIKEEYREEDKEYFSMFIYPWLVLLMGWIVKSFVL